MTAEEIVRELAALDPIVKAEYLGDDRCFFCDESFYDGMIHRPLCLWQRAQAAVQGGDS